MDCHRPTQTQELTGEGSLALIGHPNVGKSVLFQRLTGKHAVISNYPGTTVEVTRGMARAIPDLTVVDTPGVITFPPHTDDERVTAQVLLNEPLKAIVQVGDAKNLRRTLLLTVQLAEMSLPLVLALNMMDEAGARGVVVNHVFISEYLSLPVIPTTATRGHGVDNLVSAIKRAQAPQFRLGYPAEIEAAIAEIVVCLLETPIAPRAMALLWLSGDSVTETWLESRLNDRVFDDLLDYRERLQLSFVEPLSTVIQRARLDYVDQLAKVAILESGSGWQGISSVLGRLMTHPLWGLPILVFILYALYWFVGVFGAGTLVNLMEVNIFEQVINPWVTGWVDRLITVPFFNDFLIGEYGLWSIGITYALALILPIVSTFFLAFGIMEDSGYLPRLAVLTNRLFRVMGLNGKAVLPMVLGLGCVTMATLTTRVLEHKRERVLVTLLLALAVPCSAQLGVVMGMLAGISLGATMVWGGVVLGVFVIVGWLAARLIPGERSSLLVELPPLRLPGISNVVIKTLARLEWYLKEVVPLFLIGTAALFILDQIGILDNIIRAAKPLVVGWLGLPAEASAAFLMGFLRRDFGATGLFVMQAQGLLNPIQVIVAMVTITLFVPCIASVMMIYKERGWRTAVSTLVLIFPLAFLVGGLLNKILIGIGWSA